MRTVGAHEIIIESPDHNAWLGRMKDEEIERVLEAYAQRILDLKRDARFKYVTVFQNRGALAGEEWTHPNSQVTATMFVPRRLLYELRFGARLVRGQGTLRLLRHSAPGRKAGPAHRGHAGRLRRLLSLRLARAV